MPRFYYAWTEFEDSTGDYCVFDSRRGDRYLAACGDAVDAQKIVDALNGVKPAAPADLGIFG